jgi:tetratricopeptide (TPR) repeat protein
MYFQQKREGDASVELARAVDDERGRIGDPDKTDEKQHDPRPVFKTGDERRESALKKYRDVIQRFPGTGAAILARLSEGSLLLDKHDPDGAMAAYNDVKASALAAADAEVRGRALEGLGFAYELKGDLENAQKAFRELENTVDVLGFKELGLYHQARVAEAKGDKPKAIEFLKTLHERLSKAEGHPFAYLQEVADDRLRALDPTALPPKAPPGMGGPGGMSPEEMKRLIEQLKKGGGGPPGKPGK